MGWVQGDSGRGRAAPERQQWLAKMRQQIHGTVVLLKWTILILAIFFLCLASEAGSADDRIFFSAEINGKPVRLAFDTGSSLPALFLPSVQRLGLKYDPAPTNASLAPGGSHFDRRRSLRCDGNQLTSGLDFVYLMRPHRYMQILTESSGGVVPPRTSS